MLDSNSPYHNEAIKYFEHFVAQDYFFYISTIAIGEYCVKDNVNNIPLVYLLPLPFNYEHSVEAGVFQRYLMGENRIEDIKRNVIKNDVMMFAQANVEPSVSIFLTADTNARKMFAKIKEHITPCFQFVSIHEQTASQYFNEIDF